MRQIKVAVAAAVAVMAAWATPAATAPIFNGYTSAAVHQRVGPGTTYAIKQTIPAGARVQIFGCLTGLTWCDTLYAGERGWVSGHYLTITEQGQRRPVVTFGFSFGVPLVEPWWDFPGHWPPPPPPPKHGGDKPHPPPPPKQPDHHGPWSGDGGTQCGIPGKPPCSGPGPGPGPGDHGPPNNGAKCGVPGKPPCAPHAHGPNTDGRSERGDGPLCGVPGKPPCHDNNGVGEYGGSGDNDHSFRRRGTR